MSGNIIVQADKPHHITCVVSGLLPLFSQPQLVEIIFDSWQQLRKNCGFRLYGYVIMEEHLHFLAQAEQLDECVAGFLLDTGKRIPACLEEQRLDRFLSRLPMDSDGGCCLWQGRPEAEAVRGAAMLRETLDYIHINPVKRGYVDKNEQWRYSSARDYSGGEGLTRIDRLGCSGA